MAIRLQPGLYKNTKGPCCCPSQVSGSKVKVEKCCCDGVVSEATRIPTYIQSVLLLAPRTLLPLTTRPTLCDLAVHLWPGRVPLHTGAALWHVLQRGGFAVLLGNLEPAASANALPSVGRRRQVRVRGVLLPSLRRF